MKKAYYISHHPLFFILIFSFFVLLASCSGKAVLVDDTRTFANGVWNHFTPEVFTLDVADNDAYYNFYFEVVVDSTLMRDKNLPLTVNLYSPYDERRMFYAYIPLTENGRWRGVPLEGRQRPGLRRIGHYVREFFTFNNSGTYRLEVAQATSQYDMEGISSFRAFVEETEIDYKKLDD